MSLPIFIYTSYELYFLTYISGPQMLMFSLVHGDELFLLFMSISLLFFTFFLFLNALLGFSNKWHVYRMFNMAIYKLLLFIQIIHCALYITYDYWVEIII